MAAEAKCSQCGEVEEYFICGLTMHEAKLIAAMLKVARRDHPSALTERQFDDLLANFKDVST